MSIAKGHFRSIAMVLASMLVTGCVPNEGPKSSLIMDTPSTDLSVSEDQTSFAANLPSEGPTPENRPDILSLASGASTETTENETEEKPAVLQAMVEPEKSNDATQKIEKISPTAEPVVASNSERNCLMRVMYFESIRSSPDGLLAVGTVVMHRRANGAWGKSVCSVVQARNQFAPGVMSRKMQGNLTDLQKLADQILAGKRHPKLAKNVMFFHTAGLKFPYKNMRYVHVGGGNTFYYKAQRKRRV